MARKKRQGLLDAWRDNDRRGDGKSGSCGHWAGKMVNGRVLCTRCSRDLGSVDQR